MFNGRITRLAVVFAAAGLGLGLSAKAQPAKTDTPPSAQPTKKLEVGGKAPDLFIEKWVKGEPVTGFEKGKVYIVEFWATWCGPCVLSMPHLSALQREYKDKGVTVIGVTRADPRNSLEMVEKMVADKGDEMGYTVAWDTQSKTGEAWMKAAQQNTIPCSFLIDQNGTIAYIGHPMWLDEPLEKIIAGTWDMKKDTEVAVGRQSQANKAFRLMGTDNPGAIKAIEEGEAADPVFAEAMAGIKFGLLVETGQTEKAYALAREIYEGAVRERNPQQLNVLAWTIVDPESKLENKDLDLALKAATAADAASGSDDPGIIDTLAWVYFTKGDVEKAVELETKAIGLASEQMRPGLQKSLDEFKKGPRKGPG